MKATVQYDDFIGTSAADISDHTNLSLFLKAEIGEEATRFDPIGASFYSGYSDYFSLSIVCIDRTKSSANSPHIVEISFAKDFTCSEFFDLFKRFNVIITKKHGGYQEYEISERLTLGDE